MLRKAIITSAIILTAGTAVVLGNVKTEPVLEPVRSVTVEPVAKTEPVEAPVAKTEPVAQVSPVVPQSEPIVEAPAPVAPVVMPVKTTQEYAEQYLDLAHAPSQDCLDKIIATFPEKFTPKKREESVKVIATWINACSTGIMQPNKSGIIHWSLYFRQN